MNYKDVEPVVQDGSASSKSPVQDAFEVQAANERIDFRFV
jgi:hypothetical protein